MYITCSKHGTYVIRIKTMEGKWREVSSGMKNRKDAEKWAKDNNISDMETMAKRGLLTQRAVSVMVAGKQMTLREAMEPWEIWLDVHGRSQNTIVRYTTEVKKFARDVDLFDKPLMAITGEDISHYINDPLSMRKLNTRKTMLAAIQSIMGFCFGEGWLLHDPTTAIQVNRGIMLHNLKEVYRRQPFTDQEITRLLETTAPGGSHESRFWHAAIELVNKTGLRICDVVHLQHASLATAGYINVFTQKTDAHVLVPVDEQWKQSWMAGIPKEHETWVFPKEHWRFLANGSRMSQEFGRICRDLGIYEKGFHCLRSTFITKRVTQGEPIEDVAELVGHSRIETTEGYVRP